MKSFTFSIFLVTGLMFNKMAYADSCDDARITPPTVLVSCGAHGALDERIKDCERKNGENSLWNASICKDGRIIWQLVLDNSQYEVWRDNQTGALWSSRIQPVNWCEAVGINTGVLCSRLNNRMNVCAEFGKELNLLNGNSAEQIWALPTQEDFYDAHIHRIESLMGRDRSYYAAWTATEDRFDIFNKAVGIGIGYMNVGAKDSYWKDLNLSVHCIAR